MTGLGVLWHAIGTSPPEPPDKPKQMKISYTTTKLASVAFMALMFAGGMSACKSKKKAAEAAAPPSGETEVKVLCSGPEFFTDDKNFRANNLGESMDQATAKKKALSNARADMASAINTQVKAVIDNYVNSREMNNKEEVAVVVVKSTSSPQTISNTSIIKILTYYVALFQNVGRFCHVV